MKLPRTGCEPLEANEVVAGEVIKNPYPGKEHLTRIEAIDAINHLSGILLADARSYRCVKRTG